MTARRWVDASPLATAAAVPEPDLTTWTAADRLEPRHWQPSPARVVCPCGAAYRPGPNGTGPTCADCLPAHHHEATDATP